LLEGREIKKAYNERSDAGFFVLDTPLTRIMSYPTAGGKRIILLLLQKIANTKFHINIHWLKLA